LQRDAKHLDGLQQLKLRSADLVGIAAKAVDAAGPGGEVLRRQRQAQPSPEPCRAGQEHHRDHLLGILDLQRGSHRRHHLFGQGCVNLEGLDVELAKPARLYRKAEGRVDGRQEVLIEAQQGDLVELSLLVDGADVAQKNGRVSLPGLGKVGKRALAAHPH
jgi:hypothetical protein